MLVWRKIPVTEGRIRVIDEVQSCGFHLRRFLGSSLADGHVTGRQREQTDAAERIRAARSTTCSNRKVKEGESGDLCRYAHAELTAHLQR